MAAAALAKSIFALLKGGGRAVGTGAKYGAAGVIGGGLALGLNPFLGAAVGRGIMGMKMPGGRGGGITGAGAAGGAASRDSSIIAGMKPHSEGKKESIGTLSKSADFHTSIQYLAKVGKATYLTTLQNNKELIYIQKMLQGPTAARAKELRMESGRQALAPVVVNNFYGGEGGGRGAGMGLLGPGVAAAIAGIVAGALGQEWGVFSRTPRGGSKTPEIRGRGTSQYTERAGERAKYLEEQRAKEAERQRRIQEKENARRKAAQDKWLRDQQRLRQQQSRAVEQRGGRTGWLEWLRQQVAERGRLQRVRTDTGGRGSWLEWLRSRQMGVARGVTEGWGRGAGEGRLTLAEMLRNRVALGSRTQGVTEGWGRGYRAMPQIQKPWWERQGTRRGDMRGGTVNWLETQRAANQAVKAPTIEERLRAEFGRFGETLRTGPFQRLFLGQKLLGISIGLKNMEVGQTRLGLAELTRTLRGGLADMAFKTGQKFTGLNNALKAAHTVFTRTVPTTPTGPGAAEARLGGPKGTGGFERYTFNEKTMRFHDTQTQRMVKTSVAMDSFRAADKASMANLKATPLPTPKTTDALSKTSAQRGAFLFTRQEKIADAKMMSQANKVYANLPEQVKGPLKTWAQAKDATLAKTELGAKANKFVNRFFLGAIIFGFASIAWNHAFDRYDPADPVNNDRIAHAAYAGLGATLAGAVAIWSLLGLVINTALTAMALAFGVIPGPGWLIAGSVFAVKFWLTDWILSKLGDMIPELRTPRPPLFPDGILPKHDPITWKSVMGLKASAIEGAKKFWQGSFLYGTPFEALARVTVADVGKSILNTVIPTAGASSSMPGPGGVSMAGANYSAALKTFQPSGPSTRVEHRRQTTTTPGLTAAGGMAALGNLIMGGESAAKGYNDYVAGKKSAVGLPPLTHQTIKSVLLNQEDGFYGAVGKYQLIQTTLEMAVEKGAAKESDTFNEATQEKIFKWIIFKKRTKIGAYLTGSGTLLDAQIAMAKEWASIGVPIDMEVTSTRGKVLRSLKAGQSYYAGIGDNRAHIKPSELVQLLQNLRLALMQQDVQQKTNTYRDRLGRERESNSVTNIIYGGDSTSVQQVTNIKPWQSHLRTSAAGSF